MLKYKSEHYLGKEMTFKLNTNNSKIYLKFFFEVLVEIKIPLLTHI